MSVYVLRGLLSQCLASNCNGCAGGSGLDREFQNMPQEGMENVEGEERPEPPKQLWGDVIM